MEENITSSFPTDWIDVLYRSLSDMEIDYQTLNNSVICGIQTILDSTAKILTENYTELLLDSVSALIKKLDELSFDELPAEPYISVPEEKLEPLRNMAKFVPEEKREEFQEIIAPETNKKTKIITLENLYKIVMLVLAILALITPVSLDDETKELLREQNEIGLERNEIELERNSIEYQKAESLDKIAESFMDFVEYVKESGICIPEHINAVPDDADTLPDSIDVLD